MSHYLKEIHQQPEAVARTLDRLAAPVEKWHRTHSSFPPFLVLVGRGSSDHAALYGQYLFQYFWGVPVLLATPSLLTRYHRPLPLKGAWVIGLSQSGETPDVAEYLRAARRQGALTTAITNTEGSSVTRAADEALVTPAGRERAVAATKTYTTQLTVLAMMAVLRFPDRAGRRTLACLPAGITRVLRAAPALRRWVEWRPPLRESLVLGRGFHLATAMETALKLREVARTMALGMPSIDYLHGTTALQERRIPVVVFEARGVLAPHYRRLAGVLGAAGLPLLWITNQRARRPGAVLRLPEDLPEWASPIPFIVAGQLLAYALAEKGGWSPDGGPALQKVTRAR